ncbi:hypothetical protein [Paraburkholderia diazotrophica]|uniref:hypothetical protein n=1 Tax=Paraburkholderia diazotrophica TaxID=667676 RepID=UPI00316F4972
MFSDRYCWQDSARKRPSRERKDLLWPVYAWKVLYPDERRRSELNLFQETVLGLIRSGIRDDRELAALMALDLELIRFIIAVQLQPNGWLDASFRVTPAGTRLLDGAEEMRSSLQVGYAFQDAVSGDWLPRFTTQLSEVVPTSLDAKNRPCFVFDRDSGFVHRPFLLRHRAAPQLDADRLLRAHWSYRRDVNAAGRTGRDTELDVALHAIQCIDERPVALYLGCELYRDETGIDRWLISDPFRIRRAVPWLRKPFVELARGDEHVARLMQSLMPEVKAEGLTADQWMDLLEESVDLELDASYAYVRREALIRDHLARVLRLMESIERSQRGRPEELGALMTESANLIESVLQWLLREWKAHPPEWPKDHDWSFLEAKAELGLLRVAGAPLDARLIGMLAGQKRRYIAAAMNETGQGALKALLAATLFGAHERDDHPFHEIGRDALELHRLPGLTEYRNKVGAHASGETADRARTLENAKFAISWMALFYRMY